MPQIWRTCISRQPLLLWFQSSEKRI